MNKASIDTIVIGSGIGGLTVAGLLAKSGRRVLVLEKHDRAGGYAHGFKRKKYHFDAGVHLTSGCSNQGYEGGQLIAKTLQALNVYDQVEFIEVSPFAHVSLPELTISLPLSIEQFVKQLSGEFPDQEAGLRDFLELSLKLTEQVAKADEVMATLGIEKASIKLDLLFKYRRLTLAEVWGDYISDPQLKSVLAALWPYLGLPPEKVSFVYWVSMFIGYLVDGAYYCKGGFQTLADTLVLGLKKSAGEIRFKSQVTKIQVLDNQVQGVYLASGEFIAAQTVVSNADMRLTVNQLVGEHYFPKRYISRLARMQASLSIFVVYIATNLDIKKAGVQHEAFYYNDCDHLKNYNNSISGDLSWLSITAPTLIDNTLAPSGEHLLMLTTLADFSQVDDWKKEKPAFVAKMIDFADSKITGLKQHLIFVEAGSPATMERYTANYQGSAYGWDVTPEQTGALRIANKSPIQGLYYAGHWTAPGGGVYGVTYSGVQAAQSILGLTKRDDLWAACS
ncbi:MAG: NAD(P)-binding protein [Methyloprofundus sp.]|nr:NAD(P)-binding protein [Methyloprofundus sp.]